MDKVCLSRNSITQLVQHSEAFKQEYNANIQKMRDNPTVDTAGRVRDLSCAKHRHDSIFQALSRTCLYLNALVATAMTIYDTRPAGRREHTVAGEFLNFITEERVLQMAMLSDMTHELIILLRYWDTESHDVSKAAHNINQFRFKVYYLFAQNHCCNTGFTKHVIDLITRNPVSIVFKTGEVKNVGGVGSITTHITQRCLGRMRAITRLQLQTLEAEFPTFSVIHKFSVFAFDAENGAAPGDAARAQRRADSEHLLCLAQQMGVEHADLKTAYLDHYLLAYKISRENSDLPNLDVWRTALQRSRHLEGPKTPEVQALTAVLMRFAVCNGCTTSGIEQNHSRQDQLMTNQRNRLATAAENDEMKLVCDYRNEEEAAVIAAAERLWKLHYRVSRKTATPRWDKGIPKLRKPALCSAKAWLQRRRDSVEAAVRAEDMPDPKRMLADIKAQVQASDCWNDEHENEELFQLVKQRVQYLKAVGNGQLKDASANDQNYAGALEQHQIRLRNARERDAARRKAAAANAAGMDIAGAHVFLDQAVPQLKTAKDFIKSANAYEETDVAKSQVWVVPTPGTPREHIRWAAILRGGAITDVQWLLSHGFQGRSIWYNPATATPRLVWLSDNVAAKHRAFYDFVVKVAHAAAKWKLVNANVFVDRSLAEAAKPAKKRNTYGQLAVVMEEEKTVRY